jgi:hypothetical protein
VRQGKVVKNWKPRWFTLSQGQLCYYEAVNAVSLEHVLAHKNHSISITGKSSARGKIDLLRVRGNPLLFGGLRLARRSKISFCICRSITFKGFQRDLILMGDQQSSCQQWIVCICCAAIV